MPGPRRFVLTGGPGGGKTSVLEALRAQAPDSDRWILVPESAGILIAAGLTPRTKGFQKAVVRLQIMLEDSIESVMAEDGDRQDRVTVCDRGTLDSLAYWRFRGWADEEFFDATGGDLTRHMKRYEGAIHLQTTAIGAETRYRRGHGTGRHESPEQAARIDDFIARAWREHERFAMIDNAGRDWPAKLRAALDVLGRWVGDR